MQILDQMLSLRFVNDNVPILCVAMLIPVSG